MVGIVQWHQVPDSCILPCGSVVPMATWWFVRLGPGHKSICLAPPDKHLGHLYFSFDGCCSENLCACVCSPARVFLKHCGRRWNCWVKTTGGAGEDHSGCTALPPAVPARPLPHSQQRSAFPAALRSHQLCLPTRLPNSCSSAGLCLPVTYDEMTGEGGPVVFIHISPPTSSLCR